MARSAHRILECRSDLPQRFGSHDDAETFSRRFLPWYSTEHCHWALDLMTPHVMHYGLAEARGSSGPRSC